MALFRSNPGQVQGTIISVCDRLLRLGEAIGARRMLYPEAVLDANPPDVGQVLTDIETRLGISLTFPNVFPDEFASRHQKASSAIGQSRRCIKHGASNRSPISQLSKSARVLAELLTMRGRSDCAITP